MDFAPFRFRSDCSSLRKYSYEHKPGMCCVGSRCNGISTLAEKFTMLSIIHCICQYLSLSLQTNDPNVADNLQGRMIVFKLQHSCYADLFLIIADVADIHILLAKHHCGYIDDCIDGDAYCNTTRFQKWRLVSSLANNRKTYSVVLLAICF